MPANNRKGFSTFLWLFTPQHVLHKWFSCSDKSLYFRAGRGTLKILWPKKLAVSDVSRSIQSHVGFSYLIPPSSHYNGVLLFTALKMRRCVQEKWQCYRLLRVNHATQCHHVFYKYIIIISEDHLQCFAHLQMLLNRFNHVEIDADVTESGLRMQLFRDYFDKVAIKVL